MLNAAVLEPKELLNLVDASAGPVCSGSPCVLTLVGQDELFLSGNFQVFSIFEGFFVASSGNLMFFLKKIGRSKDCLGITVQNQRKV